MLAVVLPDSNGSYKYYLESKTCCFSFCTMHHTEKLFNIFVKINLILKSNNQKCKNNENVIWTSLNSSYIDAVKWEEFIYDYRKYIDMAIERQNNIDDYNIQKEL